MDHIGRRGKRLDRKPKKLGGQVSGSWRERRARRSEAGYKTILAENTHVLVRCGKITVQCVR